MSTALTVLLVRRLVHTQMFLQSHMVSNRMGWLVVGDMDQQFLLAEVDQEGDIRNKASKDKVEDNLEDQDVDSLMVKDEELMGSMMGKVEGTGHLRRKIHTAQITASLEHMDVPDRIDKTPATLDHFPLNLKDNTRMTLRDL